MGNRTAKSRWILVTATVFILAGCASGASPPPPQAIESSPSPITARPSITRTPLGQATSAPAAGEEAEAGDVPPPETPVGSANGGTGSGTASDADSSITGSIPTNPAPSINNSTEAPTLVANLPLQIVDRSGIAMGDGSVRVYHENEIRYPHTTRVELELRFENRYITATPFGSAITIVPVATSTLSPSPTPREAQVVVPNQPFFQRMGASLICAPNSFEGCDTAEINPNAARLLRYDGMTWSWLLSPMRDLSVDYALNLQLWTVVEVDGIASGNVVREMPFTLKVLAAGDTGQPPILLLAGGVAAAIVAIGGGMFLMRRGTKLLPTDKAVKSGNNRPRIFISYRRRATWAVARSIHDRLVEKGGVVFIDVDDINEGRFEEIIKQAILDCDYFILVLSPDTLTSDWVVKEAAYAIENNKRIIPVLVNGFDLYRQPLPEQLNVITSHNAVTLTPEFFKAGIDRIAEFVGLKPPDQAD